MNKEIKLIFVTCFIYLLMDFFNLFTFIETQFKNNIRLSQLGKVLSIIIPVIIITRYLNNIEGFKTETISQGFMIVMIQKVLNVNYLF